MDLLRARFRPCVDEDLCGHAIAWEIHRVLIRRVVQPNKFQTKASFSGDCIRGYGVLKLQNETPLLRFSTLVITGCIFKKAMTAAAGDHSYLVPVSVFHLLI